MDLWTKFKALVKPPPVMSPSDWCNSMGFQISSSVSDYAGPLDVDLLPYAREIIDLCANKRDVRYIVFVSATQAGKSTIIQLIRAWWIANRRQSTMTVMPSAEMAGRFSTTRWLPFCLSSKKFRESYMPMTKAGEVNVKKITRLLQAFLPCNAIWKGAGGNIIGDSCPMVIADEVDSIVEHEDHREASALLQLTNRPKAAAYPLIIFTGSPTVETGPIWQWFLRGTQSKREVPCAKCGGWIEMTTKLLRWPEECRGENGKWDLYKVQRLARLECPHCKALLDDGDKQAMIRKGRWTASNPDAEPGVYSFRLPGINAPWVSSSFGAMAAKFLAAKDTLDGLKNFIQNEEAMVWEDQTTTGGADIPMPEGSYRLREDGDEARLEDGEKSRYMCIDVQGKGGLHFFSTIRAWCPDGSSRLLWHGRLETWADITAVSRRYGVPPEFVGIDSRFSPEPGSVARFAAQEGWTLLEAHDLPYFAEFLTNRKPRKAVRSPVTFRATIVNPGIGTNKVAAARLHKWSNPWISDLVEILKSDPSRRWTIPQDAREDYRDQMAGARKVLKVNKQTGRTEWIWRKRGKAGDHYLTTERQQIAMALLDGILRDVVVMPEEN